MSCNSSSLPSSCFSGPACNSGSCFSMLPNREGQAILYYMNLSFEIIRVITQGLNPTRSCYLCRPQLLPQHFFACFLRPFPPFPLENQSSSLALDQSVVSSLSPAQDPRESGGGAMFQGQRGWFCRSVSQDLRQFWGRKMGGAGRGSQSILLLKPPVRGACPTRCSRVLLPPQWTKAGWSATRRPQTSCSAVMPRTLTR